MAPSKSKKATPAPQDEDVVMAEASVAESESSSVQGEPSQKQEVIDNGKVEIPDRVTILPGGSDTAASFQFKEEDHTVGNALRYIIMKNPDVEFCGYSIPHPSEALMNIRIQTYKGTAKDALQKGLEDLMNLCDVVSQTFKDERERYSATEAGIADAAA